MSIVFICIDCLRNDFITEDYADTPFLDSLVEESLYFSNMHSTTTTTTPCVASFMTGLYSERNGVNSLKNADLSNEVDTLAEKFKESGYNTYAEVTGPLVKDTKLDRGFDRYTNRSHEKTLFSEWEDKLEKTVENLKDPFFFYLHLWELHKPVNVPEKFDSKEYGETSYARALSALDRKLESIVRNMPENTTIVLHGDHGESITWRDSFIQQNLKRARTLLRYKIGLNTRPVERALNRLMDRGEIKDHFIEDGHGENIFDYTTNVPFIIKSPELEAYRNETQVRQIDIFPTLLDLKDIDYSEIDGKTLLLEDIEDRDAYIRACGSSLKSKDNWIRGVRTDKWKFLEYPNRNWKSELYKLEEDPKELKNIKDNEKKSEIEQKLPRESMKSSKELEIKDKLEELGYM